MKCNAVKEAFELQDVHCCETCHEEHDAFEDPMFVLHDYRHGHAIVCCNVFYKLKDKGIAEEDVLRMIA